MLRDGKFWEKEAHSPLLRRNANYINDKNVEELIARAEGWVDMAEAMAGKSDNMGGAFPNLRTTCDDPACQRIFELDAERTFSDDGNRQRMITILCTLNQELNDYHQGVAFLVGFSALFLSDAKVIKLASLLHRHYVPGYFKSAPELYVRDAKVFERLLQKFFPDVAERLANLAPAEAFASKWWIGMCVHVLPFVGLMDFFDAFMKHGQIYLMQFALALVKNLETDLVDPTKDVSKVLAALRLDATDYPDNKTVSDSNTPGSWFTNIVDDSLAEIAVKLAAVDMEALRADADEEMSRAAERRKQLEKKFDSEDEIIFSDEEE